MGIEMAVSGLINKAFGKKFFDNPALMFAPALTLGKNGYKSVAADSTKKKDDLNSQLSDIRNGGSADTAMGSTTTDTARQMLASGGAQKLISSTGLSGDTTGGAGSIRRRLLGG